MRTRVKILGSMLPSPSSPLPEGEGRLPSPSIPLPEGEGRLSWLPLPEGEGGVSMGWTVGDGTASSGEGPGYACAFGVF